jgi:isopentenyl diphosphate isomerase/L-lactate dehydrogenase-like FMN-dependent dehydrogenase
MASIEDLRAAARRRMPRFAFDYFDGAAENEVAMARNRAAFDACTLTPRVLRDVGVRDLSVELLGKGYAAPLGVAPTGLANLARAGADVMLARAAAAMNVPFVLSTAATTTIEAVAAAAPDHTWFQLYMPKDRGIGYDFIDRAAAGGIKVLMLTVDIAVPGRRNRDVRNGFALPLRWDLTMSLDLLRHPRWSLDMLVNGAPRLANWEKYAAAAASAGSLAAMQANQIDASTSWKDLEAVRSRWPHTLVVKGVMHAEDARELQSLGVDGVVISNHGGRQLDAAPATLEALPAIRGAVGASMAVMLDGGIRYGSDIAKALARGADFCFVARPTLYGVAAGGQAGAEHALRLLIEGLGRTMALMGVTDLDGIRSAGGDARLGGAGKPVG